MRSQQSYNAGVYCRLSRDDNNGASESMSIANQRQMLISYAEEKGWNVREVYVDDGFSGTTFDRPDFKRMIEDIQAGMINMVITKDLSRLGRNYVMTGQYTDFFFPQYSVRYIALGDNYDSTNTDNDIAPFKNILNEMYAKDISRKVRSARVVSAKQGKFMGSRAPYGYRKSPAEKHKLIPDDETAPIARRIFREFILGDSARGIACRLNGESILCPRAYYYESVGKRNPNPNESMTWSSSTILQLLKNPVYTGKMVQGKRAVVSFKTKQRMFLPKEDWIIVENTHEPLVDTEVWDSVQSRIRSKKRIRINSESQISLFSGILRCADCGGAMAFNKKVYRNTVSYIYRCSRYAAHGNSVCSTHSIALSTLANAVLADIRINARLAEADKQALVEQLLRRSCADQEHERSAIQIKIDDSQKRINVIDNMIQSLFEEKVRGNVPESVFKRMVETYDTEQAGLRNTIEQLQYELSKIENDPKAIEKWINRIRGFVDLETLDRETVMTLIDHITVSERFEEKGIKQQNIEISYKFVGCLNLQ